MTDTMTKDMSAVDVHAHVEAQAKKLAKPEIRDVRKTLAVGLAVRQGDVYLVRVEPNLRAASSEELTHKQLVDGTSAGSRHVAVGKHVRVFKLPLDRKLLPACVLDHALLGPVIVASADFVVTHPEHAHVRCPAGVFQVVHQQDAATRQRVRD